MNSLKSILDGVRGRFKEDFLLKFIARKKHYKRKHIKTLFLCLGALTVPATLGNISAELVYFTSVLTMMAGMHSYQNYRDAKKALENFKDDGYMYYHSFSDVIHIKDEDQELNSQELQALFNLQLSHKELQDISDSITEKGYLTHDDLYYIYDTKTVNQEDKENKAETIKKFMMENQFVGNTAQQNLEKIMLINDMKKQQTHFNSKKTL